MGRTRAGRVSNLFVLETWALRRGRHSISSARSVGRGSGGSWHNRPTGARLLSALQIRAGLPAYHRPGTVVRLTYLGGTGWGQNEKTRYSRHSSWWGITIRILARSNDRTGKDGCTKYQETLCGTSWATFGADFASVRTGEENVWAPWLVETSDEAIPKQALAVISVMTSERSRYGMDAPLVLALSRRG